MEQYAHFNTAFVALDTSLLDDFFEISFKSLKHEASKAFRDSGTYSITVTVEAIKDAKSKAQELQIEEAA